MGGAGLVGSHIVKRFLAKGIDVVVVDNLTSGSRENLKPVPGGRVAEFIRCDASSSEMYEESLRDCEIVFHCMSTRKGSGEENISATKGLLRALEKSGARCLFVRSTALIYGNAFRIPTPEDYSPLRPTTAFAKSKLETEKMMEEFAERVRCRIVVARLANLAGGRSFHGVLRDIAERLVSDPTRLRVLGDGHQLRSYVHIDDCVDAIELLALDPRAAGTFNIGAKDALSIFGVAELVAGELGIKPPNYVTTGSYASGGAWPGDPKIVFPDSSKLVALGWKGSHSSEEAVKKGAREVLAHIAASGGPAKDLGYHSMGHEEGSGDTGGQPRP
jgi:UDP-glucose 4-epimerase